MFWTKRAPVSLSNTLTGQKEELATLRTGVVTLYSCGPTVYGPAHIGNLRSYIFADTLARMLKHAGYSVRRVINITDVGHLVGDGDEGEDKMSVGAAREKKTPEQIADQYTKLFKEHIKTLNVETSSVVFPRATEFIREQISMIKKLEEKGFTYRTKDGIYFDTSRFPNYGVLGNVKEAKLQAGARVDVGEKRNPHDFALWRNAKPNDLQQWDSPWGKGNPGWSIECSAMATALLGKKIDIHTGGEDHIQVHHNNEIAQSECATGESPFVQVWMHNAFISIDGEKISKSLGNTFTLDDVVGKGIHPLALRFLYLQAHYRTPLSFSWESLKAAETALESLWRLAKDIKTRSTGSTKTILSEQLGNYLRNDLDSSSAIALLFSALPNSNTPVNERLHLIETAEKHLGLSLTNPPKTSLSLEDLPEDVQQVAKEREEARKNRDFGKSDELRIHLEKSGYRVEDHLSGSIYRKS